MSFLPKRIYILLLMGGILIPVAASAQSPQASSSVAVSGLNEQQRTGKRLFLQNCALCHVPEPRNPKDPKDLGTTVGPRLEGLFSGEKPRPEAVVRTFVQVGSEGKMPGFQYSLEPKDMDAVIAYLKTL